MINIHLCGDIMIGRSFNDTFKYDSTFNIWGNTLDIFKKSDFVMGNLETTITSSSNAWPNKAFNFKLNPKYKSILKEANFKHLNIANNHMLDYDVDGMLDTIKNLNKLNIKYSGAGMNKKQASLPIMHNVKGIKIGIVSYSDHFAYWKATQDKYGINYVDIESNYNYILSDISKIKEECDILIFSIHHGSNYVTHIPTRTKNFFHDLLSAGVDIIHGHSAHHILPIEVINNKYIFYSMGDFIDDYAIDPLFRNDLAFIAELHIENKKITSLKIHPTKITIDYGLDYIKSYVSIIDETDSDYDFVMNKIQTNIQQGGKKYKLVVTK